MRLRRRPQARQNWLTFLRNHRDAVAAFDFFVVFSTAFKPLYVWFAIEHARRRILHVNVTEHPTSAWVIQNLREAFPYDSAPKYLIFDRDSIFSIEVAAKVKTMGIKPVRTAFRCPWQNPIAERFVGGPRRDLLDHVIVLDDRLRLLREYVRTYYLQDRTHLGLAKDTPACRPVEPRPSPTAKVVSLPRCGGLHHRYVWREAAQRRAGPRTPTAAHDRARAGSVDTATDDPNTAADDGTYTTVTGDDATRTRPSSARTSGGRPGVDGHRMDYAPAVPARVGGNFVAVERAVWHRIWSCRSGGKPPRARLAAKPACAVEAGFKNRVAGVAAAATVPHVG